MELKKLTSPALVMLDPKKLLNSHGLFPDQADVGLDDFNNMVESFYHCPGCHGTNKRMRSSFSSRFVDAPEEPLHRFGWGLLLQPSKNTQGEDGVILGGTSSFYPSSVEADYKCCSICDMKFASNYPVISPNTSTVNLMMPSTCDGARREEDPELELCVTQLQQQTQRVTDLRHPE